MDFSLLTKYWYVILIGAVILYFLGSKGSSGGGGVTAQQVGGDSLAREQLAMASTLQEDTLRYSLVNTLLNYDSANKQLAVEQQLGLRSLDIQAVGQQNQFQLGQQQINAAIQQSQIQANAALQIAKTNKKSSISDILNSIFSGASKILPIFF